MRDNNTGLVWDRAPEIGLFAWGGTYGAARYCLLKNLGGTRGWRLPSVVELASLIDLSLPPPFVPASAFTIGGSPGVQSVSYWSASTVADNPSNAWLVYFGDGDVVTFTKASVRFPAWCVRGDMNADAY